MTPEMLARYFHRTYEQLAPSFGYETRTETRDFDPNTPNGRLMTAVAAKALAGPLSIAPSLVRADVVRGRICRLVSFGVPDADLPKVLAMCERLERESLERAERELADVLLPSTERTT